MDSISGLALALPLSIGSLSCRYRMSRNFFSRVCDDLEQNYDFFQQRCDRRGSLDCTHWEWDNCLTAGRGQFQRGDRPRPSFMLEAVASQDLWIWHAFFGATGSNNDINVLDQPSIFNDLIEGMAPSQQFICNDTTYKYEYYLVDEGTRKDIERAFGVLKQKWYMIQHPARAWKPSLIRNALYACVILHNMIIKDNSRPICEFYEEDDPNLVKHVEISDEEKQANRQVLRYKDTHANLKADLIEHLWKNREV
ncbi:hypothetical protein E3N88_13754 [Mikania micrantha]|uniref:DDE Tnp4 domain-containing protein n=1 Tax=Mikania micrantha TaxID=192012 RepID=A0A5N6NZH3_9ASTR|nr:hypothetical protein E3N88_13754 [Mikania micrantha]